MKSLFHSFHLNGRTLGFHPKTKQNLAQDIKQHYMKALLNSTLI